MMRLWGAALSLWLCCLVMLRGVQSYVENGKTCNVGQVWTSKYGSIYLNGEQVHIKGLTWFGFESNQYLVEGLDAGGKMEAYIQFIAKQGFNAIRLPISLELARSPGKFVRKKSCGPPDCHVSHNSAWNIKAWDMLHRIFAFCREYGILVALDMHSLAPNSNHLEARWFSDTYSEKDFIDGWVQIVEEFSRYPNFFAIDLFNEPHSVPSDPSTSMIDEKEFKHDTRPREANSATWGKGDKVTDWDLAASRAIVKIHKEVPAYTGLFMVQGVDLYAFYDTPYGFSDESYDVYFMGYSWGGNFLGTWRHKVKFVDDAAAYAYLQDRVVYSPHHFGPDLQVQGYYKTTGNTTLSQYFDDREFPHNLGYVWDHMLGFLEGITDRAVIMAEGGSNMDIVAKDRNEDPDNNHNGISDSWEWFNFLADYVVDYCMTDNMFFSLNPSEFGRHGILDDDWRTPMVSRLAMADSIVPDPSVFEFKGLRNGAGTLRDNVCFSVGTAYAPTGGSCGTFNCTTDKHTGECSLSSAVDYWSNAANTGRSVDPSYGLKYTLNVTFTFGMYGLTGDYVASHQVSLRNAISNFVKTKELEVQSISETIVRNENSTFGTVEMNVLIQDRNMQQVQYLMMYDYPVDGNKLEHYVQQIFFDSDGTKAMWWNCTDIGMFVGSAFETTIPYKKLDMDDYPSEDPPKQYCIPKVSSHLKYDFCYTIVQIEGAMLAVIFMVMMWCCFKICTCYSYYSWEEDFAYHQLDQRKMRNPFTIVRRRRNEAADEV